MINAKVYVTLKKGVLDPQGKAVQHSLASIGYGETADVRLGKFIEVKLDETDREKAKARLKEMCEKVLANTVIEDYRFEIE
ncbi:MAG: phosphoribosylformylglycinamidine synthase subunit PurS [Nitrospirae bacterium]|nr:phosphoribosylformylglycinamidine synthase subunit PurS [Nitrospirota bacterium]